MIVQMQFPEGITEELKADNPMVWVQCMNNIQNRAEEIILRDLIYEEVSI